MLCSLQDREYLCNFSNLDAFLSFHDKIIRGKQKTKEARHEQIDENFT